MALDAISEMGARNVLITLENGCSARLRSGRKTKRLRAFAPHVEPVSGAGSGDVLLAQFLAAIGDERSPDDAVRQAVASGAASVREVGAGRFDPAFAATLAGDIELAELHPSAPRSRAEPALPRAASRRPPDLLGREPAVGECGPPAYDVVGGARPLAVAPVQDLRPDVRRSRMDALERIGMVCVVEE